MTNTERRDAGLPYKSDEEVYAQYRRCRALLDKLNRAPFDALELHRALAAQLLGKSENAIINPPFYCDYGFNIHAGKNLYINYNCTILDVCRVTIGDDCLMAAKFLLDGEVPEFAGLDRRKLLICGGSAGGHLALMTGLRLPQNRVAGIISISGIDELTSDFALHSFRYKPFFGGEPTEEKQTEANPIQYLRPDSPPVLLTHWDNDQVVPVESARRFRDRGRALGCRVDYYEYSTEDEGHGIWIPDSKPHRLYPHLETELTRFIESVRPENPPCPTK